MGGTNADYAVSLAVDEINNVYTTGYFSSVADFDPNTGQFNLTSNGAKDVFVSKLDSLGNFIFTKSIGGTGNESANCINISGTGNIYCIGEFGAAVDFDPGNGTTLLASTGGQNNFVFKWNPLIVGINSINTSFDALSYPNPAGTKITVETPGNNKLTKLTVYSPESNKMIEKEFKQAVTGEKIEVDISSLPNGMYFVLLESQSGTKVIKLIKQ